MWPGGPCRRWFRCPADRRASAERSPSTVVSPMIGLRALVRRPALGTAPYAVCPAAQDLVPLAGQAVPGDARTRKWVPVKPLAGTAVIGIGNEFRRDDGLGWAAISLLRARKAQRPLPSGTDLAQCDGDPGRLIGLWEGKALTLVVDACFPPAAQPGRTHRWCVAPGEMPHPAAAGRQSTHGLGLAEAVCLADRVGRGPGGSSCMRSRGRTVRWALGSRRRSRPPCRF